MDQKLEKEAAANRESSRKLRTHLRSNVYHHCEDTLGDSNVSRARFAGAFPVSRRNRTGGFTLVEMMVTIVIYGFVMAGCGALLYAIFTNSNREPLALNEVDQANAAATEFVNEVRDASYGNDGSFPINQASTTQIIFFSPYDSGSSSTVDRIRYFVSSSTLYKGVIVPSGSPLSYNTANETVSAVISNVSLASSSAFFYYNGSYAGTSSPLLSPVNVNQITYVQLELNVQLEQLRNSSSTFQISTGAAIRNLKTNLGS